MKRCRAYYYGNGMDWNMGGVTPVLFADISIVGDGAVPA